MITSDQALDKDFCNIWQAYTNVMDGRVGGGGGGALEISTIFFINISSSDAVYSCVMTFPEL